MLNGFVDRLTCGVPKPINLELQKRRRQSLKMESMTKRCTWNTVLTTKIQNAEQAVIVEDLQVTQILYA